MRRVMTDGDKVVWYWMIQPHQKNHGRCKPLGDGLCAIKMIRYENWNEDNKSWEPEPMDNHATPEQEQVLDAY